MLLNKTEITQLNNSYIDGSYSNKGTIQVVNIEIIDPNGHDLKQPFTIRTKDGYALKYDELSGKVVYRFQTSLFKDTLTLSQVIEGYTTYFNEYTFKLSDLSTYENIDPVTEYRPPTYSGNPLFEYSDIEVQKENIYIINTGIVVSTKTKTIPVFIVSYYGKDPKRCKLKLVIEVFNTTSYEIKTNSGRLFSNYNIFPQYETNSVGTGKSISSLVSISANAEQIGEVIEEDTTDGLFDTYVVKQTDLKKIADTGKIYSEIIINTFSYPIKFEEKELLETNIILGNTPVPDIMGKRFKRAEPKINIFTFNVPYLKDVEICKLLLPFNSEIILDYDIIRGKKINGFIQYEVSTNSSTLYIDNEDVEFYKDSIVIETTVPFKPTGEYSNFKETEKRLGKQVPTLLIKCLQEEKQKQFIQGIIEYPIEGILKDELELLNTELSKGVITNE